MQTPIRSRDAGSALVLAVMAFVILGGIAAAFFSLTVTSHKTTTNASNADGAFHVAEAGLDDAMNKLVAFAAAPDNKAADYYHVYGDPTAKTHSLTGEINGGSFAVTIDPAYTGVGTYKITSIGTFRGEQRGIESYVVASQAPQGFKAGLFGDVQLDSGGNLFTDGYRSTTTVGGNPAGYQATTPITVGGKTYMVDSATGHIGSNGGVDVSGSALVFGNATPGPTSTVTGGGYVHGTKTPATAAEPIPQVDYGPAASLTLNTSFPTETTTTRTVDRRGRVTTTTTTTNVLDGSKHPEYRIDAFKFTSGESLTVKGNVTLYVDGDIDITARGAVVIESGATLTLVHNGTNFSVHGGGQVGTEGVGLKSGTPKSFLVKTNATTITINGHAGFYGALIAPKADVKLNGTADYFGAIIAKTIKAIGTASFHYDEDLKDAGVPKTVFNIKSTHQFVP